MCRPIGRGALIIGDKDGNLMKLKIDLDITTSPQIRVEQKIEKAHSSPITIISGFEDKFATSSLDKNVVLWNSKDLTKIHAFKDHSHWVTTIELNADYLVSGSRDGSICVYNTSKLERSLTIRRNTTSSLYHIVHARLSGGLEYVISAGNDDIIAMHSVQNGAMRYNDFAFHFNYNR